MTDALRPYRQLARNAHLANLRLYRAVATLKPEEWDCARSGCFPSLRAAMNHIYTVDRFYIDALLGGSLGYAAFDSEEFFAEPEALAAAQTRLDLTLVAFTEGLKPQDLARAVNIHRVNRIQTDTVANTLLHLLTHDQNHRGQILCLLAGTSIKPPRLDDFFMADDSCFRRADLATAGWTEADIQR